MGVFLQYHAEMRTAGKWRVLKDAARTVAFFKFGGDVDRQFWDLLCGDILPNTGLTYHGFIPIVPRRGVPDDAIYRPQPPYCENDYSWVLLQELIDYPWEQRQLQMHAFVDADNYRAYLEGLDFRRYTVTPPHLDGSVPLPRPEWTVVSQEQMLELAVSRHPCPDCYTEIVFTRPCDLSPYAWMLTDTIPKLQAFGDPREIRIVFWFEY